MTHFLQTEENPDGYRLEDILQTLRADVMKRCELIANDRRPEARYVLKNNVEILQHLTLAIDLAFDSTATLDKAFGKSESWKGGPPRIGVPDNDAA